MFILRKKVLAFLVKRCSRVFKAASYVSRGTMNWGKQFSIDFFLLSSHIELKQLGPLADIFKQGCQNCNLTFKKTSPMKFVFCHCSLKNFWYWAKESQPFRVKILPGFSKLHPTCREEQWLGENTLSSNCFCYLWTFR